MPIFMSLPDKLAGVSMGTGRRHKDYADMRRKSNLKLDRYTYQNGLDNLGIPVILFRKIKEGASGWIVTRVIRTVKHQRDQGEIMNKLKVLLLLLISVGVTSGCASWHASEVQKGAEAQTLTVGTVQREIRVGMSSAQVAEALGSPNVVTTDEKGREVWVYDKIATENVYSSSTALILGILVGGSGGGGGFMGQSAGASSTSQRTLTVIIKYDEQKKVRDFAYHSTRF
jgi:outer membrane protein assembly factor BamE (lipoprotein component of BamABCDE complex)